MILQVDENISIEVCFDPVDREEGFDDEIRFASTSLVLISIRDLAIARHTWSCLCLMSGRNRLASQAQPWYTNA